MPKQTIIQMAPSGAVNLHKDGKVYYFNSPQEAQDYYNRNWAGANVSYYTPTDSEVVYANATNPEGDWPVVLATAANENEYRKWIEKHSEFTEVPNNFITEATTLLPELTITAGKEIGYKYPKTQVSVNMGDYSNNRYNILYNNSEDGNIIDPIRNRIFEGYYNGRRFTPTPQNIQRYLDIYEGDRTTRQRLSTRAEYTKPNRNYTIPETDDPVAVQFLSNWLNNRRQQLRNNRNDYIFRYGNEVSNAFSQPFVDLWNLIQGDIDKEKTNEAFNIQISNAASATFTDRSDPTAAGVYYPNTHEINIQDMSNIPTRIHERTHASRPFLQENAISDILQESLASQDWRDYQEENEGPLLHYLNKYFFSPEEVYARMMEFRYSSGLKPEQVVDQDFLDRNRQLLKKYSLDIIDDNTLIRLFNEVADNNQQVDSNPYLPVYLNYKPHQSYS